MKDRNILIFFFNAVFVIIGYGINTYTNQAFLAPMKLLRMGLLGLGTLSLLLFFRKKPKSLSSNYNANFILLALLVFTGIFYAYDLTFAINRVITFLFPFVYLSLLFAYLKTEYPIRQVGYILSSTFQWTYLIPVLVLVFLEQGALGSSDISRNIGVFVKNHYGWATCMFLLVSADLLTNYELPKWRKWATWSVVPIALTILLASGSRSAWVSTLLTGVVLVIRWENIGIASKMGLITIVMAMSAYFLADPNSAFYARWAKTERQLELQEQEGGRIQWANDAYKDFQTNPAQWLTGRGLFDYKGLPHTGGYHNSYLEILFGSGVFVFFYFAYLFIFRPAYLYFKYYSKYFLTFFPLLIIPFFESNLTGGQFLFYPWFSYMMFYSINPIKKQKEDRRRMKQQLKSPSQVKKEKLIPT